ncbi:MAG: HEAT repeat domain-containing protein [Desulfobacterales bacterium]|nr:HEAT repeat domain-containing protein [Desulfobacterales bacterium]
MEQQDSHLQPATAPGKNQVHEAEQIVTRFLLAAKNLNLYPDDHAISRRSIQDLHEKLTAFINRYGDLSLEVFKTHLEYEGQQLLPGTDPEQNLAYLCYRDGIQWLIFSEGVSDTELEEFLKIVNTHQVMEEETQGDIVTNLWEADLFNIQYRTNEKIWENEPLLDLSSLDTAPRGEPFAAATGPESVESASALDKELWRLAPEEIEKTQSMAAREESRNFNEDVFEVLLVILAEQRVHQDYANLLEIIYECFVDELAKWDFPRINGFLRSFYATRRAYEADGHWALPYLDDFLRKISGPHGLSPLNTYLTKINTQDPKQLKALEEMIGLLAPESILSLGPTLPKVKSSGARRAIVSALAGLAKTDLRPLIHLFRNSQAAVAAEAIMILSETITLLSETRSREALAVLFEASRSDADSVRKSAVFALTKQESAEVYPRLIPSIADSNPAIRKMVFRFFSRQRSPEAEAALIKRIKKNDFTRKDAAFLQILYQALGSCGSRKTVDFLRTRLFARPLRIGKVRALHRAGSAMALRRMEAPESGALLEKASKSLWPTIRRATRRAKETGDEL